MPAKQTLELSELLKRLAYGGNLSTADFQVWAHNMPPDELGRLIKEYVVENNHQSGNNWEGYSSRDMTGIRHFLTDVIRYHASATDDRPEHFRETTNINPL